MYLPPQQFAELYERIPTDIRMVMDNDEHADKIRAISKKYNLHIDQLGELSAHIGYLMVGALKPKQFIPELVEEMNIDEATATKIVQEVNEQLLTPIRDSLKKIHGLDGSKPLVEEVKVEEKAKNPPPATNFDDRLGKYFSTTNNTDANLPNPRPYTQDPYREAV